MKFFYSALLALSLCVIAHGQTSVSPWLTETERAKFETLRIAGSEALFNLDYDAARKSFKEMAAAFPNYPAGPQFLADTLWAETLYQTRRMQSSLYGSDDTFYSTSDDKVDPKVIDEFRTLTRQARQLTEARLKQIPKDVEALYFIGAIEGLTGLRRVSSRLRRC
jgi:hypothetical protein